MEHKYQIRVNQYPINQHINKLNEQYIWEVYDFTVTDKDNIAFGYATSPILAYAEADHYVQKVNILEEMEKEV